MDLYKIALFTARIFRRPAFFDSPSSPLSSLDIKRTSESLSAISSISSKLKIERITQKTRSL